MRKLITLFPYALAITALIVTACMIFGCVSASYERDTYYKPHPHTIQNTPRNHDMIGDPQEPDTYTPTEKPFLKSHVKIQGQDSRNIWGGVSAVGGSILNMITDPESGGLIGWLGGGAVGGVGLLVNNFLKNRKAAQIATDHKAELESTWNEAHAHGLLTGQARGRN